MRIALIAEHERGGVVNMGKTVGMGLEKLGHDVEWSRVKHAGQLEGDFDLVHFFNLGSMAHPLAQMHPSCASTATVHHMTYGYEDGYTAMLRKFSPDMTITLDNFTLRDLGRRGFTDVRRVRQAVAKDAWHVLPEPDEQAIGWIGGDTKFKGVEVINTAARWLNIPCISHDSSIWLDSVEDLYAQMSVYVVASFEDGGPLPAQEALLCGRPVVTTHVGNMDDVIVHDENGLFYDGSRSGCVDALERVFANYDRFRAGAIALQDRILGPVEGAQQYVDIWKELI